jgi:uncharacterized protein
MKFMVWVGHPKHVHFWNNIVKSLISRGHEVKILATKKDITLYLLDKYNLEYEVVGKNYNGIIKKAYGLINNDFIAFKIAKSFNPDTLISGISLSHVSRLIKKPYFFIFDTENAHMASRLSVPFSDRVLTPSCFKGTFHSKKHIKYNGYEELAYLHSNYFKPDSSILKYLNLSENEKFIVVRFVSWKASHDKNDMGFTDKVKLIKSLENYGKILISSEAGLPEELEKYKISIPPEKIHHLLYFADLYIGESSSMAAESAILGTPSIFVSTSRRGFTDDLEYNYNMLYSFSDPENGQETAINKAIELLSNENTKELWQRKREKLLSEKIDVTSFMVEFIEKYPQNQIT